MNFININSSGTCPFFYLILFISPFYILCFLAPLCLSFFSSFLLYFFFTFISFNFVSNIHKFPLQIFNQTLIVFVFGLLAIMTLWPISGFCNVNMCNKCKTLQNGLLFSSYSSRIIMFLLLLFLPYLFS